MKILLLNPHVDASHEIAQVFQKKGIALILSNDPEEAWQMLMLHGSNTDLVILHKEFLLLENKIKKDVCLEFIERIQKSTVLTDIPIILTSEKWGDPEFVQH
ncbi:MAG: hypothetical protein HY072_00710, partial [Deltaproteobacteria bacterium]|nr:hypothetical protein [Deltaproteobacteria bacterium]